MIEFLHFRIGTLYMVHYLSVARREVDNGRPDPSLAVNNVDTQTLGA